MYIKPNIVRRCIAGFIDYFIIYGFTFLLIFTLGEPNLESEYELNGVLALLPVLLWLLLTVVLESMLGGTIGNSVVGLKVIPMSGIHRNLTFGESLIRHLLDPIDMFFFGLVGILTIHNTKKNQRLGDLAAKTIVVHTKRITE